MSVTSGLVARAWRASGAMIAEPGRIERFCTQIKPLLAAMPGYHGAFVLLDREHGVARGLSIWDDVETMTGSWPTVVGRAEDAFGRNRLDWSAPSAFSVVYSSFPVVSGMALVNGVERPLARVSVVEGGSVSDPAVLGVLASYAGDVTAMPGCLAGLLLSSTEGPRVVGVSFWADQRSVDRTAAMAADASGAVPASTGSTFTDGSIYEALVVDPVLPRRVRVTQGADGSMKGP